MNPDEGERTYGDVELADPVNKAEVERIKDRIRAAAHKHDVDIESE